MSLRVFLCAKGTLMGKQPYGYQGVPKSLRPVAEYFFHKAKQVFDSTVLGRLVKRSVPKPIKQPKQRKPRAAKPKIPESADALLKKYKGSDAGKFIRDLEKYSKGADKQVIDSFLDAMGSFGQLVKTMIGDQTPTAPGMSKDLRTAINFAAQHADRPDVLQALQQILEGQGAEVTWSNRESPRPADSQQHAPVMTNRGARVNLGRGGFRNFPPDHPIITGDMQPTPDSSNVHSFGYDLDSHSLYVRFQDKPDGGAGPIYRYFNCPPELFLSFLKAGSAGKFVWDRLRIRGTVSGHQLDYALVGIQKKYVPRKATLTAAGEAFIPRSVFTDRGNRLESKAGYKLVRPLVSPVNQGKPNRGRPNTGRP